MLILLLISIVSACKLWQDRIIRSVLFENNIHDAFVFDIITPHGIAYTDIDKKEMYIDCGRFSNQHTTFINVVAHETLHLQNFRHVDCSPNCTLMCYYVREYENETIIDDDYILNNTCVK
jgi:hypothetical protein